MALVIYNTLTRQKEKFEPLIPGQVKMYVCGPTVYNFLHVGNFRGPVVFNMVRNWLEVSGYKVEYALNFTDVDDKIIDRANKENINPSELSERYIEEYKKDFASLGLKPHTYNPKVTEHMNGIINMVDELVKKTVAYEAGGDVLYSVKSFKDYGKLSGRNVDELLAGARVDVDEKKKDPMDFALWKKAKEGEPAWDSPWGAGRPGWHIECSAMIKNIFGDQIDIHGGGSDLMFPHHENEIAQSEGCTAKSFVKYWMHNQMINFSGQKMSKSIGNIVTLREFLSTYHPEIYKWMILSSHYRSISDFGEEAVQRAVKSLARVYSSMALADSFLTGESTAEDRIKLLEKEIVQDAGFKKIIDEAWGKVEDALNDDFNTPEVFASLFEVIRVFNSQIRWGMKINASVYSKSVQFLDFVKKMGAVISLFQQTPSKFLNELDSLLLAQMNLERSVVDQIVNERSQARISKDFQKSDELRKKLTEMGISVNDTPTGSTWEVTK